MSKSSWRLVFSLVGVTMLFVALILSITTTDTGSAQYVASYPLGIGGFLISGWALWLEYKNL